MSEDEVFALMVSGVIALLFGCIWLVICTRARLARPPGHYRWIAALMPLICLGVLLVVLRVWASHDVRDSGTYLFFYTVMGAAWMGLGAWLFPFFGLSLRDDVLERRNGAALWAICGALLGLTLCFAGANIGDGPGWWVVVLCAFISTVTWFLVWLLYQKLTHVADHITIDRDPAAAFRLAGFLTASGLVLGRAVAGDWVSLNHTVYDFAVNGWPVLALLLLAIFIEQLCRPTPEAPLASPILGGYFPALLYLAAAVSWAAYLGPGN